MNMDERTALYRHFAADGRLLYVGISLNAVNRLSQHRVEARWYEQVARVDIQWLSSREAALKAELEAIRTEHPIFNIVGAVGSPTANAEDCEEPLPKWPLPASRALIAWDRLRDDPGNDCAAHAVAVGHLLRGEMPDWTDGYDCTAGAANVVRRDMTGDRQRVEVMLDWYMLVYTYGVDPRVAHRAFLNIAEFQEMIKERGIGPDKNEPGYDPDVGFGRMTRSDTDTPTTRKFWHSEHVFPPAPYALRAVA